MKGMVFLWAGLIQAIGYFLVSGILAVPSTNSHLSQTNESISYPLVNDPIGVQITPNQSIINQNSSFVVDIVLDSFSNVQAIQFPIKWDTAILSFESIQNTNPILPGFSVAGSFGTAETNNGLLTMVWFNTTQAVSSSSPIHLFSISFKMKGDPCAVSSIYFDNQPIATKIDKVNQANYPTLTEDASAISACPNITVIDTNIIGTSCPDMADGSIELNVVGGQAPYSFNWSNGAVAPNVSFLSTGFYSVSITDQLNDIYILDSLEITSQFFPISISNITINPSSNGDDGAILFFVSGGNSPYQFLWSNGEADQIQQNLAVGFYSVTITDQNDCQMIEIFEVTAGGVTLDIQSLIQSPNCLDSLSGSIDLNLNGGNPPFSFSWSNGNTSEDLTDVSSGTYDVTILDNEGNLFYPGPFQINDPTLPSISSQVIHPSAGLNDGSIELTINGGQEPYQILWNTGETGIQLSGIPNGLYSVSVSDQNGCISTDSFLLFQSSEIEVDSIYSANCNIQDGGIDISIIGGNPPFLFLWSNGTVSEDLTGVASGIYHLTVTDNQNNSIVDSFEIPTNDLIIPTISCPSQDVVYCDADEDAPFTDLIEFLGAGGIMSDDCGLDSATFTFAFEFPSANVCPRTITRIYAIDDLAGNVNSCTHTFQVTDTTPPSITCPMTDNATCGGTLPTPFSNYADFINSGGFVEDNCAIDQNSFQLINEQTSTGITPPSIIRTYEIADLCGNISSCQQTFISEDTIAPTFTNPPIFVTVSCGDSVPFLPPTNPTDNCTNNPALTHFDLDTLNANCFNQDTILRKWSLVDNAGNQKSFLQYIIGADFHPPQITITNEPMVECIEDIPSPYSTFLAFELEGGVATDPCGQLTPSSFQLLEEQLLIGVCPSILKRTYEISDACGNRATTIQNIIITDETAPQLFAPADLTLDCPAPPSLSCERPFHITEENPSCEITSSSSDVIFNVGEVYGNTGDLVSIPICVSNFEDILSFQFTIEWNPEEIEYQGSTGSSLSTFLNFGSVLVDQGKLSISWADISGDGLSLNSGSTLFYLNFELIAGLGTTTDIKITNNLTPIEVSNIASGNQADYEIEDGSALISNIILTEQVGLSAPVATIVPNSTVAIPVCTYNFSNLTKFNGSINWDPSLLSFQGISSVSFPGNVNFATTNIGNGFLGFSWNNTTPQSLPNASNLLEIEFLALGNQGELASIFFLSNSANNIQNNVGQNLGLVSIDGEIGFGFSGNQALTDTFSTGSPTGSDNCGLPNFIFTDSLIEGNCPSQYLLHRKWIAIDPCQNQSAPSIQKILVGDYSPPFTQGNSDSLFLICGETIPNPVYTDDCEGAIVTDFLESIFTDSCSGDSMIYRKWWAVDACANVSDTLQQTIIKENAQTVFTIPSDVFLQDGESTLPVNTGMAFQENECALVGTISFSDSILPAANCESVIWRTWTLSNPCGIIDEGLQVIQSSTLSDIIPVLELDTLQYYISSGDSAVCFLALSLNLEDIIDTVIAYNDQGNWVSGSFLQGDYEVGIHPVSVLSLGNCGEIDTLIQILEVIDDIPPVLVCPNEIEFTSNNSNSLEISFNTVLPYLDVTDNCDIDVIEIPTSVLTCNESKIITVTAYDIHGNTSDCSITISLTTSISSSIEIGLCSGNQFENYSSTGVYIDTFSTPNGCDSIRFLSLTVDSIIFTETETTICQGQGFGDYTDSGFYIDTFSANGGCDSIVWLTLSVEAPVQDSFAISLCEGEIFEGYTETGMYRDTLQSQAGCDSFIRILNLIVLPRKTSLDSLFFCEGESHLGYTQTGTYIDSLVAQNGCDSIRISTLVFQPSKDTLITASFCSNEDYFGYSQTGIYIDSFSTSYGCDSIRTLDLTFLSDTIYQEISICENENWNDLTQPGSYVFEQVSTDGCDSISVVTLTVLLNSQTTITQEICEGESFEGYMTSGIYSDVFVASNGCDSIRTLELTVIPTAFNFVFGNICPGESYFGYSNPGTYTDTLIAQTGCDSIRTLQLSFSPGTSSFTSQTICAGDSFEGYDETGFYTDTISSENGCDSIRTIELTVVPPIETQLSSTVCLGEIVDGYSETGTYIDTFLAFNNCDSIRTLNLVVLQPVSSFLDTSICQGTSFLGYAVAGIYVDSFLSNAGCDSTRTLNLSFIEPLISSIEMSICEGESFLGYSQNGTFTDTLLSQNGCDSFATLILTIVPSISQNIVDTICAGEDLFGYNQTGIYIDTFISNTNCDSIRILDLFVKAPFAWDIEQSICQGDEYLGYNQPGIYLDSLGGNGTCDTIRTLTLNILPFFTKVINQTICEGEEYNGYSLEGNYIDTLNAIQGCDTIRTLNLIVNPSVLQFVSESICQGENYLGYSVSGIYVDTFLGSTSCDSIRSLDLTVLPQPSLSVSIPQDSICQSDSLAIQFDFAGTTPFAIEYRIGMDSFSTILDASSTLWFSVNTNTDFEVLSFSDASSCPGIMPTESLSIFIYQTEMVQVDTTLCDGMSLIISDTTLNLDGFHTFTRNNDLGCLIEYEINLVWDNLPLGSLFNSIDTNICEGTTLTLVPTQGFDAYLWSNGSSNDSLIINESGIYSVTASTVSGCQIIDSISVLIPSPFNAQTAFILEGDTLPICGSNELPFAISAQPLPPLSNGLWTALDPNITFTHPEASATQTAQLPYGYSTIIWTVSHQFCDYQVSDTMVVSIVNPNDVLLADAGEDLQLCPGDPLEICNDSLPTNYLSNWSNLNSEYSLTIQVDNQGCTQFFGMEPGIAYTLEYQVENLSIAGGCGSSRDTLIVQYGPPNAAPQIPDICAEVEDGEVILYAEPVPEGGFGFWSLSPNGTSVINIENPNEPITLVSDIPNGEWMVYWNTEWNYDGCEVAYQDSILLYAHPENAGLQSDTFYISDYEMQTDLDVLNNDQINFSSWDFYWGIRDSILPSFFEQGENGRFDILLGLGYEGNFQFSYFVEHKYCPMNLQANVFVFPFEEENSPCDILNRLDFQNKLTPNGDGINDFLALPQGLNGTSVELIVFDRNHHVLFSESDYQGLFGNVLSESLWRDGSYFYCLTAQLDGNTCTKCEPLLIIRE